MGSYMGHSELPYLKCQELVELAYGPQTEPQDFSIWANKENLLIFAVGWWEKWNLGTGTYLPSHVDGSPSAQCENEDQLQ
jgi:hypothetical protein